MAAAESAKGSRSQKAGKRTNGREPRSQIQDPRIQDTLRHINQLARRHSQKLITNDYLTYRAEHAPELPALNTLYRIFSSWDDVLRAAGVDHLDADSLSRTSDDDMIKALQDAAKGLGVSVLSTQKYDAYRAELKTKKGKKVPPSSSVIRKWFKNWANAVAAAGLESPNRAVARKATPNEIIGALREAKSRIPGMMTTAAYNDFRADLPEEEVDQFPDLTQIFNHFAHWDAALAAADVEQSDLVHPTALWTEEEARRLARSYETVSRQVYGRDLDERAYNELRKKSTKMTPTWEVLQDLLSS